MKLLLLGLILLPIFCNGYSDDTENKEQNMTKRSEEISERRNRRQKGCFRLGLHNQWDKPRWRHLRLFENIIEEEPSLSFLKKFRVRKTACEILSNSANILYKLKSRKKRKVYLRLTIWDRKRGHIRHFSRHDVTLFNRDPLRDRDWLD